MDEMSNSFSGAESTFNYYAGKSEKDSCYIKKIFQLVENHDYWTKSPNVYTDNRGYRHAWRITAYGELIHQSVDVSQCLVLCFSL